MLGFKTRSRKYKRVSQQRPDSQYSREQFIKSPDPSNEKTPKSRKRSILIYWLSSLRVYLSREGPALGPLPHSIDDLRKEQIQNHKLSQVILAYDLQAVGMQNRLLIKHAARKRESRADNGLIRQTTPENVNVFDFKTPPGLRNYPRVSKVDSDESFDLQFQKSEDKGKAPKMVIKMAKPQPRAGTNVETTARRPLEGSSQDLLLDFETPAERGEDTEDLQAAVKPVSRIFDSKSPLSKLPRTPAPTPPKARASPSSIAILREPQFQHRQSPLSKDNLRRNSKTADVNRRYFETLQLPRRASDTRLLKSNLSLDMRSTSRLQTASNDEELGTPESSTSASILTREFTTPTLDPHSRSVFGQGQRIRMERYSMRPVEAASQDVSFEDFTDYAPNESNTELLPGRTNVPRPHQKVQAQEDLHRSDSGDEEHVVFFDLEDSRRGSIGGGSLLRRSSSSISGSFKALRHVGRGERRRDSQR